MKKSFLSILFFAAAVSFAQRYEFRKITKIDAKNYINFLNVTNEKNWLVNDKDANLYFCKNGKVTTIPAPSDIPLNRKIIALHRDTLFLAGMDSRWHSHFYFMAEKKFWIKENIVFELPIHKIFSIGRDVYAIGNFGSFLKRVNGKWQKIETSLKSHINFYAALSADSIYLLTNNEGLYFYNGKKFQKSPVDIISKKITSMASYNRRIFLFNRYSEIFELADNRLFKISRNRMPVSTIRNEIGLYSIRSSSGNNRLEIPPNLSVYSFNEFKENQFLLAAKGGIILKASPTDKFSFFDLAKAYGISGLENTNGRAGVITDFDGDNLPDIFSADVNRDWFISFYKNNQGAPFSDLSDNLEYLRNSGIEGLLLFDFNGDLRNDLVTLTYLKSGVRISFNYGDNKSFRAGPFTDIPAHLLKHAFRSIVPVDIDKDGDLDLSALIYYGPNGEPGYNIFLINNFFGLSWDIDTSYKKVSSGWNTHSIFADFNNDNQIDWLLLNKWRRTKLFINVNGKFIDESEKRLENNTVTEDFSGGAVDIDNDGDLDLIISTDRRSLQLYKNNGKGYFADFGNSFFYGINKIYNPTGEEKSVKFADLDNDGYTDILFFIHSVKPNLYVFMNDSGKAFIDRTEEIGIQSSASLLNLICDLNGDGDIDIYQINSGYNRYWENTNNDNNFIKIKLQGAESNFNALGAKIHLYKLENGERKLAGYRQLGSCEFDSRTQSELTANFGVDKSALYAAEAQFYGGNTISVDNISSGETIVIKENSPESAFLYSFPSLIVNLAARDEIQLYFLIVIFCIIITFAGIRFGISKFKWDLKLNAILITVNLSIVWILIFISYYSESIVEKYFIPPLAAFVSISLPILMSFIFRRQIHSKLSIEKMEDELLQLLITFSHGEWALRNINSLQLFMENHSSANSANKKYVEQMLQRIDTFIELTQINLKRIIELSELLAIDSVKISELKYKFTETSRFLEKIRDIQIMKNSDEYLFKKISLSISRIKEILSDLKTVIYAGFSCDPISVIEKILSVFRQKAEDSGIELIFNRQLPKNILVLIKKNELADIIDNLITNSIRAVADAADKQIKIAAKRLAPKIIIEITDTGVGIKKNEWKDIFERGYSKSGGTGEGLYSVKNSLKKFGGQIYVKSSIRGKGTTFTIELLEGKKNETASVNN